MLRLRILHATGPEGCASAERVGSRVSPVALDVATLSHGAKKRLAHLREFASARAQHLDRTQGSPSQCEQQGPHRPHCVPRSILLAAQGASP
ncbi:hypothetical protein ON010_g17083 [Phytophthora cinnamomi]|nr:hypothetical protein ON010_g17083 [Phytophthora cinnamomi]